MTNNSNEDFSGDKFTTRKKLTSDVFRLEERLYKKENPIADAYDKIINSEAPKPINETEKIIEKMF